MVFKGFGAVIITCFTKSAKKSTLIDRNMEIKLILFNFYYMVRNGLKDGWSTFRSYLGNISGMYLRNSSIHTDLFWVCYKRQKYLFSSVKPFHSTEKRNSNNTQIIMLLESMSPMYILPGAPTYFFVIYDRYYINIFAQPSNMRRKLSWDDVIIRQKEKRTCNSSDTYKKENVALYPSPYFDMCIVIVLVLYVK